MSRPTRKTASQPITTPVVSKTNNFLINNKVLTWIRQRLFLITFGFLVSVTSITCTILYQKYFLTKTFDIPTSSNVDTNGSNSKILLLEEQIDKQITDIKKLETTNDTLSNSLKVAEKRIQFHNELLKRMCEYIVVITVDKKIIPRQCLSDYNWRKEEHGN